MALISGIQGVSVSLVEGLPADISVQFSDLPGFACGQANFPVAGNPGSIVRIDPTAGCTNDNARKWMIAHEFGHALGFRHTNWQAAGEPVNYAPSGVFGANQVALTPPIDASSFMNNLLPNNGYSDFSTYDYRALFALWPDTTNVSVSYAGNIPHISWTSMPSAVSYDVALVAEGEINTCVQEPAPCWHPRVPVEYGVYSGSALSTIDYGRLYTGTDYCIEGWEYDEWFTITKYKVVVYFPKGWTIARRQALVNTRNLPSLYCW
jgi:hypothetical protein